MLMSRCLVSALASLWLLCSQAADLGVASQSPRLARLLSDLDKNLRMHECRIGGRQTSETAARYHVESRIWAVLHCVLTGKKNEVVYNEIVSGHNYANFQSTSPDGLIALLGQQRH